MSPDEIRTVTNWLLDAGFTVTVVKKKPLQLLLGVPDEDARDEHGNEDI
jgi:hypothetical protein